MSLSGCCQIDVLRQMYVLCLAGGFAMACGSAALADEPSVLTVDWQERAEQKIVPNGEVIEVAGDKPDATIAALKVVSSANPGEKSGNPTIHLTTIEKPGITKRTFALKGRIQHKGVEGTGYLEMWVVLPDGSQYFSRTLGSVGPMKSLSGDSGWREIALPFQLTNANDSKPTKLILNVVLPGAGEIVLSDLTLRDADNLTAAMSPGAWWSDQAAGRVGGIGGSILGLIGAVVGTLCGMGIGRRFVVPLLIAGSILGGGLFVLGVVALSLGQPYGVYYPLLLCGMLCGLLGIVGLFVGRQRYVQHELRRIQALDS